MSVQYESNTLPRFCFHVSAEGKSIMGVDLFDALGFKVFDSVGKYIAMVSSDVDPDKRTTVQLANYPKLTRDFGCIKGYQHKPMIDSTVQPVRQGLRRLPLALRDEVSTELKRMLDMDLIEKIDASPWISNLVLVRKKDKTLRVCTDMTNVNRSIIPEYFPLATLEELTSQLAGAKIFSKLDLKWGYLQVSLAPETRYLTAFVCHEGVFQSKRLVFGMCSAPSAFTRIIQHILAGIEGVVNLLDDILVYGSSLEEHDKRLKAVLERLELHEVVLNITKCLFGVRSIEFDGHLITDMGVRPLSSNVDGLRKLTAPVDAKQLKSFISAAGFYMRFIPHFAEIVERLRCLLRQGVEWEWTKEHHEAFSSVLDAITSATILAHFNPKAEIILTTDASAVALGACLRVRHNGQERPVAFASRVLSSTERNYSATEREALACIWGAEKWHFYLYGRKFTLRTDHQALKTLLLAPGKGPQAFTSAPLG